MASGVLGSLLNAQVSGAAAGQALGPAQALAQGLSVVQAVSEACLSGIKGVLGSLGQTLPSGSGTSPAQAILDGIQQLVFGEAQAATVPNSALGGLAGAHAPALGNAAATATHTAGTQSAPWLGPVFRQFTQNAAGTGGLSAAPNVGGILFDHCAAVCSDIGEIAGAYWDASSGSLVLLGRRADGPPLPVPLPAMDRDHLLVALRAYLAGQPIGVSIDPPAEYRDGMKRGVTPPDGAPMLVSYLGMTEGTLFGAIMFEADRLLKCLDKGIDNVSRASLRASVPGFRTLLEMIRPGQDRSDNVWHRFWFVIDAVELRQDPTRGSIAFGDVRLKVLTEVEKDGQANQAPDPNDQAFVEHLTVHFDEYAREFPILARLKELAKVAALGKLLCQQQVPLDLGSLFLAQPRRVDTPASTPGIKVTGPNVEVERHGNTTITHWVSLFGGVDLDPQPRVTADDGTARRLRERAEAARPSPSVAAWSAGANGTTLKCRAIRLGPPRLPFRRIVYDHRFQGVPESTCCLWRVYDSAAQTFSDFGPGWTLGLPFAITVLGPGGKRAEVVTRREVGRNHQAPVLVLHDLVAGASILYRRVQEQDQPGAIAFCRVVSQKPIEHGTSFQYDAVDPLFAEQDAFILKRQGRESRFDSQGRLVQVLQAGKCLVEYQRQDARIVRILDHDGHSYDLEYDRAGPRIVAIGASDGRRLEYAYEERRNLMACRSGDEIQESYGYNARGLLTEVRGPAGRLLARSVYDDLGNRIDCPSDVLLTDSGQRVSRTFDASGQLIAASDQRNGTARFRYGSLGELSEVDISGDQAEQWHWTYAPDGRLAAARDSRGRTWLWQYDAGGRLRRSAGPSGPGRTYYYDADRIRTISDDAGRVWNIDYDAQGNPELVIAPDGSRWTFRCAHEGSALSLAGPPLAVKSEFKRDNRIAQTVTAEGLQKRSVFDSGLRLLSHRTSGAGAADLDYNSEGVVSQVRHPVGATRYQVDEPALTLTVTFSTA